MKLLPVAVALLFPFLISAQNGNEQDVEQGRALFRSNCAFCHGLTAGGGRGPSLISAKLVRSSTDEDIKKIIRTGVPGTSMPSFDNIEKDDLDKLVRYIRHLGGSNVISAPVSGDPVAGKTVYARNGCGGCHRVGDEGSNFGPELTRIGAGRAPEYIHQSIVDPSADIPAEYEGVTVVTKEGKKITGVRINEDTFTVQLRLGNDKFALFDKSNVKEVIYPKQSLMPAYKTLPAKELQNLLAYLDKLRGQETSGADATKAKGIK